MFVFRTICFAVVLAECLAQSEQACSGTCWAGEAEDRAGFVQLPRESTEQELARAEKEIQRLLKLKSDLEGKHKRELFQTFVDGSLEPRLRFSAQQVGAAQRAKSRASEKVTLMGRSKAPWDYFRDDPKAVQHAYWGLVYTKLHVDAEHPCGNPDKSPLLRDQKMWFTAAGCTVASEDTWYSDCKNRFANVAWDRTKGKTFFRDWFECTEGQTLVYGKKGSLIHSECDDVLCPIPLVPDCYFDTTICRANEWCWTMEHAKWGPWAQGVEQVPNGFTPDQSTCQEFYENYLVKLQDCNGDPALIRSLNASLMRVCPYSLDRTGISAYTKQDGSDLPSSGVYGGAAWKPIRGQCVPFRQEGESCKLPFETQPFEELFPERFVFAEDGNSFDRPLLCDTTKKLACTGPKFTVLPSTCVQERQRDVCYMGPWWDSTECPARESRKSRRRRQYRKGRESYSLEESNSTAITPPATAKYHQYMKAKSHSRVHQTDGHAGGLSGGLTYDQAVQSLIAMVMLYPTEYAPGGTCEFWDVNGANGAQQLQVRVMNYNIAKALWPSDAFEEEYPPFDELQRMLPNPFNIPGMTRDRCEKESEIENSEVALILARAQQITFQPCKVWSAVHFLTFNLKSPVSTKQQTAARAIAVMLEQNFWCNDCRGFWAELMETIGLPPMTSNAIEIAWYYWNGHNMASEHVATTRGGNPWIHQLGAQGVKQYQNPFYMGWELAYKQWKCPEGKCY